MRIFCWLILQENGTLLLIFDAIGFELNLDNPKQSTFIAPDSTMFNLVPGAEKLKPQDKKTLQITMLQTGRLRTTWFYSWGQLRGQTHGGSGRWTTSKTYLTSSSSEYQRTMVKWIYHFPRYEGSGPKQMGMLIEGISIHDRSGLSWLPFKS